MLIWEGKCLLFWGSRDVVDYSSTERSAAKFQGEVPGLLFYRRIRTRRQKQRTQKTPPPYRAQSCRPRYILCENGAESRWDRIRTLIRIAVIGLSLRRKKRKISLLRKAKDFLKE